jgi:carbamoyltransferase
LPDTANVTVNKKNDAHLNPLLLAEVEKYNIDKIAFYERPWLKQLRRLRSGETIQWNRLTVEQCLRQELGNAESHYRNPAILDDDFLTLNLRPKIYSYDHHKSHAAAGFQTSSFDRATVVVIDAIGEFDTITIWGAEYDKTGRARYKKLWGQKYPHSIGLFYSAMTKHVGLKPIDEEYIMMGMAAYGQKGFADHMKSLIVEDEWNMTFKDNLHVGVRRIVYVYNK